MKHLLYIILFLSALSTVVSCRTNLNAMDEIKWGSTYMSYLSDTYIKFFRDSSLKKDNSYAMIYQKNDIAWFWRDSIFRANCIVFKTPNRGVVSIKSSNPAWLSFENYEILEDTVIKKDSVRVTFNFPNLDMECIILISFDYNTGKNNNYKYVNKQKRIQFKNTVSCMVPIDVTYFMFALIPIIDPFDNNNSGEVNNFSVPYITSGPLSVLRNKGIAIKNKDVYMTFPNFSNSSFTLWNIDFQYLIVKPSCIYWKGEKFELCGSKKY